MTATVPRLIPSVIPMRRTPNVWPVMGMISSVRLEENGTSNETWETTLSRPMASVMSRSRSHG